MAVIQARLSDDEAKIIRDYAKASGVSTSMLIRDAVFEKIEGNLDLALYTKAMKQHETDPDPISFDKMMELING